MKKIFLFTIFGVAALQINAQYKNQIQGGISSDGPAKLHRNVVPYSHPAQTANKTTAGGSRSYNHAETMAETALLTPSVFYDNDHSGLYYMWQDSTVRWPAPNNGFGINYLSFGQMFHPQSGVFNDVGIPGNQNKMAITNADPYTIDSVTIRGLYSRTDNSYVDTLIFKFVHETGAKKFSKVWFPGGTVLSNHGIDTFFTLMYPKTDYFVNPIVQTAYGQPGSYLTGIAEIKVPLDDAIIADTLPDGTSLITVVPTGLSLIAGAKAALSVTFKSGTSYTSGTSIDAYNYFALLSHETAPGSYVSYYSGDYNQSSVATKDSAKMTASPSLNFYYAGLGFTAPYSAELHNVAWHVSCNACITTTQLGVNTINSNIAHANAYPNPANDELNIPVTLSRTAHVKVSLINTLGQIAGSKDLGIVNAGNTATANFSTHSLPAGVYMYRVDAGESRYTDRVVIAH